MIPPNPPSNDVHQDPVHERHAKELVVLAQVDPRANDGKRAEEEAHAHEGGHQLQRRAPLPGGGGAVEEELARDEAGEGQGEVREGRGEEGEADEEGLLFCWWGGWVVGLGE